MAWTLVQRSWKLWILDAPLHLTIPIFFRAWAAIFLLNGYSEKKNLRYQWSFFEGVNEEVLTSVLSLTYYLNHEGKLSVFRTCNTTQCPDWAAVSKASSATTSCPWPKDTLWKLFKFAEKFSFSPSSSTSCNRTTY